MNIRSQFLPTLQADLLLVHAPAFFDFRQRRDIYFPFLGTSGDVPITPLYEYFPLGFKTLQRFLTLRGFDVKIINLCTLLLRYPHIDIKAIIEALDVKLVGIDLHWMVHVQGSLAIAEQIKNVRPDLPTLFGGISSTLYAKELIRYSYVNMVMRGYDTHEPMAKLMENLKHSRNLSTVPNLLWKTKDGEIQENGFEHMPDVISCAIDWSDHPLEAGPQSLLMVNEFLSAHNVGCKNNCGWCGGSRDAFRRIYNKKPSLIYKHLQDIEYEFDTLKGVPGINRYHYYAVGSYNQTRPRFAYFLDKVAEANLKSISYELLYLTPVGVLKRMVEANKYTILTLSPESHDQRVAKLAGRGFYTNEELESWIERALDLGIRQIDLWYFIGMPEQDEKSVIGTVEYCRRLLQKFKGKCVNPMICPMTPFLDPGSNFFSNPEAHGYRVFYRTLEEHRRGMLRASIINRINYETKWLSRSELISVGYRAVQSLMEAKSEFGSLPTFKVNDYNAKIDTAMAYITKVHEIDCIMEPEAREQELDRLGDEIQTLNSMIFFSGVMNQAYPINRKIGGRWFDELGWEPAVLEDVQVM